MMTKKANICKYNNTNTTITLSIDGDDICTVYCDDYRVFCHDYGTHGLFVIEERVNEKTIAYITVDEYYD